MCAKYIVSCDEFNPEQQIVYTEPKINKNNGINVGILNKQTNKALYISTPLMFCWGVQKYVDEANGRESYSLSLQFPGSDYMDTKTQSFLDSLKQMEEKLLADAMKNCKTWLNRAKLSEEVAKENMTPILRYPKDRMTKEIDYNKSPTLSTKVPYYEGKFNMEIYDMNGSMVFPNDNTEFSPESLIPKATNVALIIQCGGIYNVGGRFGVTWRIVQAVVKPKETLQGKCHISLGSDERNKLANQEDAEEDVGTLTSVQKEVVNRTEVQSSESESESESDNEEEPTPEPVKKPKVIRRKVATKK